MFRRIPNMMIRISPWLLLLGYVLLVIMPIINTALYSVSKGWFAPHLLPPEYTLRWYQRSWVTGELGKSLANTLKVAVSVVFFTILITFPAAYIMARKKFPAKDLIIIILLMPLLIPPLTYGIPVARVIYTMGLSDTIIGIVIIQILPIAPYVLLILRGVISSTPYSLEEQAVTLGANKLQVFWRVVLPVIRPGIVTASAWAMARSISEFGLTFLVAGARTQTLAITLYGAMGAVGTVPQEDAALTMYLIVPSIVFIGLTMRFMKAETITLKGV